MTIGDTGAAGSNFRDQMTGLLSVSRHSRLIAQRSYSPAMLFASREHPNVGRVVLSSLSPFEQLVESIISDAAASHREAKLTLSITQSATTATTPALANAPDTTAALNKITPSAYAILFRAHRMTPTHRPNTK